MAEADESDGSFLRLPPRRRHRHQRAARPPRLLRHVRERPAGVCRVRRVRRRRRPARGLPGRRGLTGPGRRRQGGRPAGPHLWLVRGRRREPERADRPRPREPGDPDRCRWATGALRINIPGRHNLLNAAAAYTAATAGLGQDPTRVLDGLSASPGPDDASSRRARRRGQRGGRLRAQPGKVAAVVGTGAELVAGQGRLVVVFQPHLYSRTRDFALEFAAALAPADAVVLMEVYGAREDPIPGVSRPTSSPTPA